ncbi:hypothetical protein BRD20_07460 [Halobacteriales archaeon SW_8_65_20]|nr:MAG: hypothetical protein BRD20_07460 [Halobacteriales archaeon SW_8_65_20]
MEHCRLRGPVDSRFDSRTYYRERGRSVHQRHVRLAARRGVERRGDSRRAPGDGARRRAGQAVRPARGDGGVAVSGERLRRRLGTVGFRVTTWLLFGFVLLPVVVVVSTSLSPTPDIAFPPESVSLRWYESFFLDESQRQWRVVRRVVTGLLVIPLPTPLIVLALALTVYFTRIGLTQSYLPIVLGHTLVTIPFVYVMTRAVLARVDWQTREAARDLGASRWQAFREAVVPQIRSGVAAAAFVAAILSLHEFLIALFVSSRATQTLPVLEWSALRNFVDPMVSVVSTLLIVATLALAVPVVLVFGVERLARVVWI